MSRIVIVGGGMGGASLALLLAQKTTHDIVLIEQTALAADTLPDTSSYDARSTALALGSAEILAGLGAWPVLAAHTAPITHIQISHQGHFGAARLDAQEEGVAALGFVAENRHLGYALLQALRNTRVAVRAPTRVETVLRRERGFALGLADGSTLAADLLVIADGAQSLMRDALGIGVHTHAYGATAIICNVTPRDPHHNVAYERFTANGALAFLPLTGVSGAMNRCAMVWSMPDAQAKILLAANDQEFLAALAVAAGDRLGGFLQAGVRSAYPLIKTIAMEQAVPGAVLLGNAAHLLHPVAGQGFNLALRDAAALAATLADAQARGESAGDLAVLLRYVGTRARDQQLTTGLSHGLPEIFVRNNPLLAGARDVGLLAFDLCVPLKREFARQAMGIGVFNGNGNGGAAHAR